MNLQFKHDQPMKLSLFFSIAVLLVFFESSAETAELIIFESETCEWCEVWDEEIGISYNKSREGSIAPLRRVDIDGDLPADLEHLEGLLYTPTFIVLDNGQELGRIVGYPGEDFFWHFLNEIIVKLKPN